MSGTISFNLHNNYSQDVIVRRSTAAGLEQSLNQNESASVQVFGASDGRSAASWDRRE